MLLCTAFLQKRRSQGSICPSCQRGLWTHSACQVKLWLPAKQIEPSLAMSRAASGRGAARKLCCSFACRHWAQVDWDQAALQALLYQRYPDLIETYMRLRHPAMRADLAKFMILHT